MPVSSQLLHIVNIASALEEVARESPGRGGGRAFQGALIQR